MAELSLDQQFIAELFNENIEIESFKRFLDRKKNTLKTSEKLNLQHAKQEFVELQRTIAKKVKEHEATAAPVSSTILEANKAAAAVRQAAAQARARVKFYQFYTSGQFPEDTNAQKAILEMLQRELNKNSLNMNPADYAQKITDEFIERLEVLAVNHPAVLDIVKKLAELFNTEAEKLQTKKINSLTYIKNCKAALQANQAELTRPQALGEKTYYLVIDSIYSTLSLFEKLYTWLMSIEQTKNYKPFFAAPKTQLAKEVSTIQTEFNALKQDVEKSEAAITAKAEKAAQKARRAQMDIHSKETLLKGVNKQSIFSTAPSPLPEAQSPAPSPSPEDTNSSFTY